MSWAVKLGIGQFRFTREDIDTMQSENRPLYAVLIDGDNIPAKYGTEIFDEIASFGEASIRRIYADFSGHMPQGWSKDKFAELAIVPHQQFANTTGKNASDIALVIDAMDILHSGRFDGFVLVSSDSDFTRLASRIREQGLDVYGMGNRQTPGSFVAACTRFIYVENLVSVSRDNSNTDSEMQEEAKEKPAMARTAIRAAMQAVDIDSEWIALGPLGKQLNATDPSFDSRNYGCRNLSTLIKSVDELEMKDFGGTLKVRTK
jgi:hypothetical protein